MKRFIALLAVVCLLVSAHPAAAGFLINARQLRVSGALVSDYALTLGSAVFTDPIKVKGNVGFSALYIEVDAAGDVDIYAEYSYDAACTSSSDFSTAYIAAMDGTFPVDGNIATGVADTGTLNANGDGIYIPYIPRMAPCMRIVLDPDADSTVTAILVYQEED